MRLNQLDAYENLHMGAWDWNTAALVRSGADKIVNYLTEGNKK